LSRLIPYEVEITGLVEFEATGQLLELYFAIKKKKKMECNKAVQNTHIDFKKAYDSVRKEVLYNVLIEFGMPMKLVILIKMFLSNT
jgi:hypothetical protein